MRYLTLWLGMTLCALLLIIAIIGPYLPFVTLEEAQPYIDENKDIIAPPFAPSKEHLLGTDKDGKDILSIIVYGARSTLLIVFMIVVVRFIMAIPLAILATKKDSIFFKILYGWHHMFSGLPVLFGCILILNLPFFEVSDHRTLWVIVIVAAMEAGRIGYIFQQQSSDLSKRDFIQAGRMIGNTSIGLYKRYYFPYLLPQMIVSFVLDLGRVMLLIGQLAFFSIFISQEWIQESAGTFLIINTNPDWTSLLAGSRNYIRTDMVWIPLCAAGAIAFSVIAFNVFGEGLRQYFDGRSRSNYSPRLEKQFIKQHKKQNMTQQINEVRLTNGGD